MGINMLFEISIPMMTFREHLDDIEGTKEFRILHNMTAVTEAKILPTLNEILKNEEIGKECNGIILDGIITYPLFMAASLKTNIKVIVGKALAPLAAGIQIPPTIKLFTEMKPVENRFWQKFNQPKNYPNWSVLDSEGCKRIEEKWAKKDKNLHPKLLDIAKKHEKLLEFDEAAEMYKDLGMDDEAIRIRKLKAEQGAVKVIQKVVHGDEVTKTEIKDSVLNRSNIGAGGDDKFTKLKELKEMLSEGLIDDDEFKQMKKEILGE